MLYVLGRGAKTRLFEVFETDQIPAVLAFLWTSNSNMRRSLPENNHEPFREYTYLLKPVYNQGTHLYEWFENRRMQKPAARQTYE
jgi:hypothetical protein